jgi:hypothetical protein
MMNTQKNESRADRFTVAAILRQNARDLEQEGFTTAAVYVASLGEAFFGAAECGCPVCLAQIESSKCITLHELEKVGATLNC